MRIKKQRFDKRTSCGEKTILIKMWFKVQRITLLYKSIENTIIICNILLKYN